MEFELHASDKFTDFFHSRIAVRRSTEADNLTVRKSVRAAGVF